MLPDWVPGSASVPNRVEHAQQTAGTHDQTTDGSAQRFESGREVAQGRQVGGPRWFRNAVNKTTQAVSWLMRRYGMITLFVLAAVPNPIFEIAGLSAGAVRMNFWRFLGPVMAGKILRGMALAYLGEISVHILGL